MQTANTDGQALRRGVCLTRRGQKSIPPPQGARPHATEALFVSFSHLYINSRKAHSLKKPGES